MAKGSGTVLSSNTGKGTGGTAALNSGKGNAQLNDSHAKGIQGMTFTKNGNAHWTASSTWGDTVSIKKVGKQYELSTVQIASNTSRVRTPITPEDGEGTSNHRTYATLKEAKQEAKTYLELKYYQINKVKI